MIPIVTTSTTSLWSPLLQHLSRHNDLYCYSIYYVLMIYIITATITSLWPILLQQLLRPNDLYCYSNYYVPMLYTITATITSLCSIVLQQLLRPNDLFYYSNSYVTILSVITASNTSLWSLLLQPIISLWSLYPANVRHAPIAATGGPPPDAPYQERPGGRHAKHPRICILCYHIVFFCFAICVIRYLPNWRP